MIFVLIYLILKPSTDSNISSAQELHGEFKLYQNQVYVAIPSNGYYKVPKVDQKTFEPISDKWIDNHVGRDKNHVYCGNKIMPQLKPKQTKIIGQNYYSDGELTYYCNRSSSRNQMPWWQEIPQIMAHTLFNTPKPQNYHYPLIALPKTGTPYYSLEQVSAITNGEKTYFKGKLMTKANPKKLHYIKSYHADMSNSWRTSDFYISDDQHLYYKNKLLPLKANPEVYSINAKFATQDRYLIDPKSGSVIVNDLLFPQKHNPYQLLSEYEGQVYHTLWRNKKDIFYYDNQSKTVKKLAKNPLASGKFKEIGPLVFSDGKTTIVIDHYERWIRYRKSNTKKLVSRHTAFYRLKNLPKGDWRLKHQHQFYQIWQKGDRYYLFDNWGQQQSIKHPVYQIIDQSTLKTLLKSQDLRSSQLRQMIEQGKLTLPDAEEIVNAESNFDNSLSRWYRKWWWLVIASIFIIGATTEKIRKRKQHKDNLDLK